MKKKNRSRRNELYKKSQISVFIIIVVFLLFTFGIVHYLTSSRVEEKSEQEYVETQLSSARVGPVREYVTTCLDKGAKEGLVLLGKQGGALYQSQGGTVPDPQDRDHGKEYLFYDDMKIQYGINWGERIDYAFFNSSVPTYPWDTFPRGLNRSLHKVNPLTKGFYGTNTLVLLNNTYENSVQEQLEAFVVNYTLSCADFSVFERQGLSFEREDTFANVTFSSSAVLFELTMPLVIRDTATGARTDVENFVTQYDVALKPFFVYLEEIIDRDVNDIAFNLTQVASSAISVQILEGIHPQIPDDDLVVITDLNSRILDKPYVFRFARNNRPPAIVWVNSSYYLEEGQALCEEKSVFSFEQLGATVGEMRIENSNECYNDPFVFSNYVIPLRAYDPDEDDVTFTVVHPNGAAITTPFADGTGNEDLLDDGEFHIMIIADDGSSVRDTQRVSFQVLKHYPPPPP